MILLNLKVFRFLVFFSPSSFAPSREREEESESDDSTEDTSIVSSVETLIFPTPRLAEPLPLPQSYHLYLLPMQKLLSFHLFHFLAAKAAPTSRNVRYVS